MGGLEYSTSQGLVHQHRIRRTLIIFAQLSIELISLIDREIEAVNIPLPTIHSFKYP
jgi:hypothetical protein